MDTKSLPFASYDVAVYLPGGAVIIALIAQGYGFFIEDFSSPIVNLALATSETVNGVLEGVFWLAASYLIGHLAAFISSYVVEKPVHTWLGYPADVWLAKETYSSSSTPNSSFEKELGKRYRSYPLNLSSSLALVVNLPVAPAVFVLWFLSFWKFPITGFYMPKMPTGLKVKVEAKLQRLAGDCRLEEHTRWDKVIEHYVANNCARGFARMYNYLTIYGALRLLSLVLLGICWFLVIRTVSIWWEGQYHFSLAQTSIYYVVVFLYVMSVMAFAKFNRRYFEESIYAFLFTERD